MIVGAQPDKLTMADVARHNNGDDCWLVIDNKVYDATRFVEEHPGGKVLVTWAGSDATEVFEAFHPEEAEEYLAQMFVGPLDSAEKKDPLLEDFRALKTQMKADGLYEPSHAYFAYKFVFNLGMLALAVWSMIALGGSTASAIVGAVIIALFWQQCGWLSHDYLHHQVYEDRSLGHAAGYFIGNVLQGFSVSWWINKHNTHHAVPNVVPGVREGDPDTDTMPFLAWSNMFLDGEYVDGFPPFLVRYQHILFLPLLCIARISWVVQSIITVATSPDVPDSRTRMIEAGTLALHYAYYGAIAYFLLDSWHSILLFVFLSQAVAGLALGTVFVINHNSMEILDSDAVTHTNFVAMQIRTTRNITPSLAGDWFSGGLSYQIEHHLFPSLPRHRFSQVVPRVRALAEKHGLQYQSIGYFSGLVDVLRHLKEIASSTEKDL